MLIPRVAAISLSVSPAIDRDRMFSSRDGKPGPGAIGPIVAEFALASKPRRLYKRYIRSRDAVNEIRLHVQCDIPGTDSCRLVRKEIAHSVAAIHDEQGCYLYEDFSKLTTGSQARYRLRMLRLNVARRLWRVASRNGAYERLDE